MAARISALWLMVACIYFLVFLLDPGSMGSIDGTRRLQTAHWLWGAGPPTIPGDADPYIIFSADGTPHYWYGIGQSLLMMPGDMIAAFILDSFAPPAFSSNSSASDTVRAGLVALLTFPVISALTALMIYLLFTIIGLSRSVSIASTVAAFLATRLLNVSTVHQESSAHFLFLLAACVFVFVWMRTSHIRYLCFAAAFVGYNVLIRLTTLMDLLVALVLAAILIFIQRPKLHLVFAYLADFTKAFVPILATFILLDRIYHYYRFGEFMSTYLDLQQRRVLAEGTRPEGWPWLTPFWEGFASTFFSPTYGVFYFDPLAIAAVYMLAAFWRELPRSLVVCAGFACLLLVTYAAFYARYYTPQGGVAWGDRYVATPAVFLSVLAFPMWWKCRNTMHTCATIAIVGLFGVSVCVQAMSVLFQDNLEYTQMRNGLDAGVLELRLRNTLCYFLSWPTGCEDYLFNGVPATTHELYFWPFKVSRISAGSTRLEPLLIAVWGATLSAVLCILTTLFFRCLCLRSAPKGPHRPGVDEKGTDS